VRFKNLEARAGIEPAVELLQSSALPLGYRALNKGKETLREKNDVRKNVNSGWDDELAALRAWSVFLI
jgi:hypothetical protein